MKHGLERNDDTTVSYGVSFVQEKSARLETVAVSGSAAPDVREGASKQAPSARPPSRAARPLVRSCSSPCAFACCCNRRGRGSPRTITTATYATVATAGAVSTTRIHKHTPVSLARNSEIGFDFTNRRCRCRPWRFASKHHHRHHRHPRSHCCRRRRERSRLDFPDSVATRLRAGQLAYFAGS